MPLREWRERVRHTHKHTHEAHYSHLVNDFRRRRHTCVARRFFSFLYKWPLLSRVRAWSPPCSPFDFGLWWRRKTDLNWKIFANGLGESIRQLTHHQQSGFVKISFVIDLNIHARFLQRLESGPEIKIMEERNRKRELNRKCRREHILQRRMCLKCKDFYWFILCRLFREWSCPLASPLHGTHLRAWIHRVCSVLTYERTHTPTYEHSHTNFRRHRRQCWFSSSLLASLFCTWKIYNTTVTAAAAVIRSLRLPHTQEAGVWVKYTFSYRWICVAALQVLRWIGLKSAKDARPRWRRQMARKLISLIHVKFSYTFFDFVTSHPSLVRVSGAWRYVLHEYAHRIIRWTNRVRACFWVWGVSARGLFDVVGAARARD